MDSYRLYPCFVWRFLGLITGYVLWTSDKTLPNGEKVYTTLNGIESMAGLLLYYL